MGALVETALVADNFTGVECRAAPRGWLSGVAVEAAAAEVLSFFGGGVICMLNGKASMRGKVGHGHRVAWGGRWTVKGCLGGNNDWCSVLEFYGGIISVVGVVLEFVEGGMRGGAHGGNEWLAVECRGLCREWN
jgi:hypothetical protein